MISWVVDFLRGALVGALLVLPTAGPAWAQTAPIGEGQQPQLRNWQVHMATGNVNWRSLPSTAGDDPWHPVRSGTSLAPPAEVKTAANGSVELQRGGDQIRVGADTRLTLEDPHGDLLSLIRQAAGAVWYKVKSVAGRKFEVEGRYLVATVKGTEFRIVLGSKGDLLTVTEGAVRATPRGGGEGMDVAAGQSVLATASGLMLLIPPPGGEPAPPEPPTPTTPPGPAPPSPPTPEQKPKTGDMHGVNATEKHNHGGQKGAGVRDTHGDSKSANDGGAKANGPK